MKIIRFEIMREQEDTQILEPMRFDSPDETFEANFALAKSLAYNGEVTVEEVEDEAKEPTTDEILNAMLGVE